MLVTSNPPIILEFIYNKPIQEVWEAITQPEKMKNWFFEQMEDFKPEVGFETVFPLYSEDRTFTHMWKVFAVETLQKLTTEWTYSEYAGKGHVTFLVEKRNDNSTKLTLINEVMVDFPTNIPEFTRDSCIAGWNYFLKERLTTYLN